MDIHQNRDPETGKVYITGAGPGDPDLITLRAVKALQSADVVVYDRLANPELLSHAPENSEHIYVGKRPDKASVSQQQINQILIAKANEGKCVVRLKGGDPFVFGRGGEECEALRAESIAFEVIPGISSALSAPAFAGIPVTHRQLGRSFTVVTGHTINSADLFDNWDHLTGADTLIVLMGMRNLQKIAETLIHNGKSPETPVAVIANATREHQQVATGTLQTIAECASKLTSPATIVIGELASMHHDLDWFQQEQLPREVHQILAEEEEVRKHAI
ncbi:MAG: uroporphyrinogen-III C-methyltransferase [Balneolaceae bacterium]